MVAPPAGVNLRPAVPEDVGFFFFLAQDPTVRSASLSTGYIYWIDHVQWFNEYLDRGGFAFVGQSEGGEPIGSFRSDMKGVVSVAVAPRFRGRGLGQELITKGSETVSVLLGRDLTAFIRPENQGSQEAFSKAGYRFQGTDIVRHVPVMRFEYQEAA